MLVKRTKSFLQPARNRLCFFLVLAETWELVSMILCHLVLAIEQSTDDQVVVLDLVRVCVYTLAACRAAIPVHTSQDEVFMVFL
jgi:hypothetical protein